MKEDQMEWELTDEEILAVDSPGRDLGLLEALYDSMPDDGKGMLLHYQKAIAQAEAKKLVETYSNPLNCDHFQYMVEPHLCNYCWQELRCQVGLEVIG